MATVVLALIGLFALSALIDIVFGWSLIDWLEKGVTRQKPKKYEGEPRPEDPSWHEWEFIRRKISAEKVEKGQIFKLPQFIRDFYGEKIIMSRYKNGVVALYSSKQWHERKQEIEEMSDQEGVKRFMKKNGVEVDIGNKDMVEIPNFLFRSLEGEGRITFTYHKGVICLERNPCLCDTERCGKCLASNCKVLMCDTHKALDKLKYKQGIDNKQSDVKKEIELLKKIVKEE